MKSSHSIPLSRIIDYLLNNFPTEIEQNPQIWELLQSRLSENFDPLFKLLQKLYKDKVDFDYFLQKLFSKLFKAFIIRKPDLREDDGFFEENPAWFQSHKMIAGVCYVDLFANDLNGIEESIPYFTELGLTYLHLMPLFDSPDGENDGGFAVSNFRKVNPDLGTMDQLRQLAGKLRKAGIHLCLDLILNHTSDEYEWAIKARAGEPGYRDYYFIFNEEDTPNAYQQHLRVIFPAENRGSFTYLEDLQAWVWTTFHEFQWDLNYSNPAVFNQIADEMFFLLNIGVRILRIDAVAFIWKQMGTSCENLPQVHWIIQAYKLLSNILAPGVIFKSEAIVHPDDVVRYIKPEECQISYNPLMMATSWEALATRKVELLERSLKDHFDIPAGTAWVNYVRVHDDIGWTFSDEAAADLGINGYDHRQFLNDFYTGKFPGSFARGLPFQFNPDTRDMRISGACASLAGLEKALEEETEREVELAIKRILLLYSIPISIGGIPLIYLGDEIAMQNDYRYRDNPVKAEDSRWVHRQEYDREKASERKNSRNIAGKVFQGFRQMIELRKENPVFGAGKTRILTSPNPHVLGYTRRLENDEVICLVNFAEMPIDIHLKYFDAAYEGKISLDMITGEKRTDKFELEPYQVVWLRMQ